MNFTEMALKAGFTIRDMDVIAPHGRSLMEALMRFQELVERNAADAVPDDTLRIQLACRKGGRTVGMSTTYVRLEAIEQSAIDLVALSALKSWKSMKAVM